MKKICACQRKLGVPFTPCGEAARAYQHPRVEFSAARVGHGVRAIEDETDGTAGKPGDSS